MADKLKLKHLNVSGFKSFSNDQGIHLDLGDVNILMGANGAGKSNVVSFFKMLSFMMSGSFQEYVARNGSAQVFLHYGSKVTDTIKGDLFWSNKGISDKYSFSLSYASPDNLIIVSEELEYTKKESATPYKTSLKAKFQESALLDTTDRTAIVIRKLLSGCKVYQFHDTTSTAPIRQAVRKEFSDYLQAQGNNLAAFLYRLKEFFPENYKRIITYVRSVVPQFSDFYLAPNDQGYVLLRWLDQSANDYIFFPDQFSDGSIRFIALATLLLQPPKMMPPIIIVDEPELGLHPSAIVQLSEMIKDASLHAQVLVATQSPLLMDQFTADEISIVEYDEDSQSSVVTKLSEEGLGEWLEQYTLSELWGKNVLGGKP
ncbi:hypothetical protein IX308_000611 [Porphyromonas levii]|uniref:AAA family ATPase n=1 Tax=Porphyromonas levii TaxID=28114 RepID=UPI001B8C3B11|nr:AAA family ATPase [Porphyromonas levii]MBR8730962.1 hypothetical protein [Porphyromonas levii]MBR8784440.1 hypothetical protein [Porphyromonas levii]